MNSLLHSHSHPGPSSSPSRPRVDWFRRLLLGGILAATLPLEAQTNLLLIDYEWADSVQGPWSKPPSSDTYVQPDGSLVTLASEPQKHFRLSIHAIDFEDVQSPVVQVAQLRGGPTGPREIAEAHLAWMAGFLSDEGGATPGGVWAGARLAPFAYKLFDPTYRNGGEPAYIEFKIISDFQPADKPAEFLTDNEGAPECELGHILVSLHEGDLPVPEFSEEGGAPCEELLKRVGVVPGLKIMRFGPGFATVENDRGELLANAGTYPFRISASFLDHMNQTYLGEFDSELTGEAPPDGYGGPNMEVSEYRSYEEFKEDYLNNPVYRALRARKQRMAAGEWALLRGELPPEPPVIRVLLGTTTHLLKGLQVVRYFLDDDEDEALPLAEIGVDTVQGGLRIDGNREGSAPLTLATAAGDIQHFEVKVSASAGGPVRSQEFTPGWQPYLQWVTEGGFEETPRYWQAKDGFLWCPQVGCGPVAWAMLFGWWDRHGVPATFYANLPGDLTVVDAPLILKQGGTTQNAYLHVKQAYALLHDYCDVICDAGATPPGDMIEGGIGYLIVPYFYGRLTFSSSWAWDTLDPDWNEPSNRIRKSIKQGRPAVIGLGWMWHYALAYAYRYQEFQPVENVVLLRRRWFKCNMGWKNHNQGAWYSGGDTFLGASIRPWQK